MENENKVSRSGAKLPWLSAVLNLFFFGGGYIYNGQRTGLGISLIIAWVLIRAGEIPIYLTHLVDTQWLILFLGIVFIQFSLAADAYREAKSLTIKN